MESEKEGWLRVGVEGEGMKTEMSVGGGSTVSTHSASLPWRCAQGKNQGRG